MGTLFAKLTNLLTVKSLVTLLLALVFSTLTLHCQVSADQFLTVFTVVISFYFGTQAERKSGQ